MVHSTMADAIAAYGLHTPLQQRNKPEHHQQHPLVKSIVANATDCPSEASNHFFNKRNHHRQPLGPEKQTNFVEEQVVLLDTSTVKVESHCFTERAQPKQQP